ncbi:MAG: GTPase RsgA [Gemmatimonadaceae bacterium]
MRGVVLRGTGGVWTVRLTDTGETLETTLRGRLKVAGLTKLAVGDDVELEQEERGTTWAIRAILPRRSQLARRAPGEGYGERIVAANLDQVVIVFAMVSPEPHLRMLDRFLVIAEANEIAPRIVVNKIDLAPESAAHAVSVSTHASAIPFTSPASAPAPAWTRYTPPCASAIRR